jgi:ribosomal-protein-alanine N-acetyltransferase
MSHAIHFPEEFPTLEGERIQLNPFGPEDVEPYFEMRSDLEFMKYLGRAPMKNKSEARDRVSSMIEDFKRGEGISWKISLIGESQLIGYIGFWRIDFKNYRAEVGFGLQSANQNKGYTSEALKLAIDYGFNQMGFHSITADVDPRNKPSVHLLEKQGFVKEAHLRENYFFNGEFLDSLYFGLLQSDLK